MQTEINEQPASEQKKPILFKKSIVNRNFEKSYPELDHNYCSSTGRYLDEKTGLIFSIYLSGWNANPSSGMNAVYVVGKILEDSVSFSEDPRVHLTYESAKEQTVILAERAGRRFEVFSAYGLPDFKKSVIRKYQEWNKKKNEKNKDNQDTTSNA